MDICRLSSSCCCGCTRRRCRCTCMQIALISWCGCVVCCDPILIVVCELLLHAPMKFFLLPSSSTPSSSTAFSLAETNFEQHRFISRFECNAPPSIVNVCTFSVCVSATKDNSKSVTMNWKWCIFCDSDVNWWSFFYSYVNVQFAGAEHIIIVDMKIVIQKE